jgi:hypothetical protein
MTAFQTVTALVRGCNGRSGRRLLSALVLLAAVVALMAACGGDDEEPEEPAKPVSGTFVGTVPGTNAFVAIVAQQKRGDGEREVAVYMCERPFGWFTGSARANGFSLAAAGRDGSLRNENAQTVQVKLAADAATGSFRLEDGRSLPFRARRATGVAGLYEGTVSGDRRWNGSSAAGGKVRARIEDKGGRQVINGTFIGPDGESVPFESPIDVKPGDLIRSVALPDGSFQGKTRPVGGGTSGYTDWLADL